jgi:hypothetical protein
MTRENYLKILGPNRLNYSIKTKKCIIEGAIDFNRLFNRKGDSVLIFSHHRRSEKQVYEFIKDVHKNKNHIGNLLSIPLSSIFSIRELTEEETQFYAYQIIKDYNNYKNNK